MDPGEDPDVWLAYGQFPTSTFDIIVKHAATVAPPVDVIRAAVATADPSIPIYSVAQLPDAWSHDRPRPIDSARSSSASSASRRWYSPRSDCSA